MIYTINERLRDLRDDNYLKQIEMAKILGITQANYSRWETGKELIPLEKLNIFCNYFHITMDYIIGISNNRKCLKEYPFNNKIISKKATLNETTENHQIDYQSRERLTR